MKSLSGFIIIRVSGVRVPPPLPSFLLKTVVYPLITASVGCCR